MQYNTSSRLLALCLGATIPLASSGLAFADTINDNIAASGPVTLTAGGSAVSAKVWVQPQSNDGDPQCNFDSDSEKLTTYLRGIPSGVTVTSANAGAVVRDGSQYKLVLTQCGSESAGFETLIFSASSGATLGSSTVTLGASATTDAPAEIPASVSYNTSGGSFRNEFSIPLTVNAPAQVSTTLAVTGAAGTYGGTTALSATLKADSTAVAGKTVTFKLNGTALSPTAVTDVNGVAKLDNVSLGGIAAGSYPTAVAVEFAGDSTHAASSATGGLTVNQRPITVAADAKAKTYGEADPALTHQITSGSLVTGDSLTGVLSRVAGENVGSYAIQQGNLSAGTNYALTFQGADLAVTKRAITVTADAESKTYGESDPALTYQVTAGSLRAGDQFSGSLSRAAGENAGTYAIQQGSLSAGTNYDLSFRGADFVVGQRVLSVTADDKAKTYGQTDPALTYRLTGGTLAQGDELAGALTRAAGDDAGDYEIQQGTVSAGPNYQINFQPGTFTVAQKAITVTADPQSKTYGQADPALTYHVPDGALIGNDTLTGSLAREAGDDAGTYAIQEGTLSGGRNYAVTFVGADLTVAKKAITVSADATAKTYGDTDPALTYTVPADALVGEDVLTGALRREAGEDVGSYAITSGTLSAGANYDLTVAPATLTVVEKAVVVTADPQTKVYGDADPELTYTVPDGALVRNDALTGALTRRPGSGVGTYEIEQGTLTAGENYQLTVEPAVLTVTAKPITVTPLPQSKTYGEADPELTYTLPSDALVGTDALSGALSRESGQEVGSYAITAGSLSAGANYALTVAPAALTVAPKAITVTAAAQTKTYGDIDPALTYTTTPGSLVGQDELGGELAREAGEAAGTYAITRGTLDGGPNYRIEFVGADLVIGQRVLAVTADPVSKTYGEQDPALTYTVTSGSLAQGDSLTGGLTRGAGEDVGEYDVQQGTLSAGQNYHINFQGAQLTVEKKKITVTAVAATKTYGEVDPTLHYIVPDDALVGGDRLTGTLTRTSGTGAGTYAIQQGTLTAGGNYDITFVGAPFTVEKKAVTATAVAAFKVYGSEDPQLRYTVPVDALVSTDVLSGSPARLSGENVGTYRIEQGTLSGGANYELTFVEADFAVTPKAITVAADPQSKVYGAVDPELTVSVPQGALVDGDVLSGSLVRAAGEDVGEYEITGGSLSAGTNYTLTVTPAELVVTPKEITVTAAAASKVYGDADPALGYTLSSELVGQDEFEGALARDAGENVGSYTITQGTLAASANYNLIFVGANLAVTKRVISVKADNKVKVLGAADPLLTHTMTAGNLVGTDMFTGQLSRTAGEGVGSYTIQQGTLTAGDNYDVTYSTGTLRIEYATGTCLGASSRSILQPINADGTSVFKSGATVPAKFRVCDASGTSIGTPGVVSSFKLVQTITGTVASAANEEILSATADTAFRWSTADQQWIFNISTKNLQAGKTYVYEITLNDGTVIPFRFGLR